MKKIILALCVLTLCGCAKESNHTCQMRSDEYEWKIEYETNDTNQVVSMTQSVLVKVSNTDQMQTYQVILDEMFDEYIKKYSGACSLEKSDLDTIISRTIKVDFQHLTKEQKNEINFEEDEKIFKEKLENSGYQCK